VAAIVVAATVLPAACICVCLCKVKGLIHLTISTASSLCGFLTFKKNLEAAILTSEHTAFLATLSATTKEGNSLFFSYFSVYSLDSRDPRLFQVDLKRVCPAQRKNWEIYLHIRFFATL